MYQKSRMLPAGKAFVLSLMLTGLFHPVRSAILDTLQSGTAVVSKKDSIVTVSISPVLKENSFLVFSSTSASVNPENFTIGGEITNNTTITFYRDSVYWDGTVQIRWHVFEFSSGVSVQHGMTRPTQSELVKNVPINNINPAKSFLIFTTAIDGGTFNSNDMVMGEITSSTNIRFTAEGAPEQSRYFWQVITIDSAFVQALTATLSETETVKTFTLPQSVATAQSFVLTSAKANLDYQKGEPAEIPAISLSTSSTIRAERAATGASVDLHFQVIELTDGTSIQHGAINFAAGVTTNTAPVSSINMAETGIICPGIFGRQGTSSYTDQDNMGFGSFIFEFTNSTTVQATRAIGSGETGLATFQTINFNSTQENSAPVISLNPLSQSKTEGETVSFTVNASGFPTPAYQWKKNGANLTNDQRITGATTNTLSISNLTQSDTGTYTCLVSNTEGSVSSAPAVLTISEALVAPTVTTAPSPVSVITGESASFSVTASGNPAPVYQWLKNNAAISDGGSISGASTATVTISPTALSDSGNYSCRVSNSEGTVTSASARLTVSNAPSAPVITSQPASKTVVELASVEISITAGGYPAPNYQWSKNGTTITDGGSISGATTASLYISGVVFSDSGEYTCTVTNSEGSVTSNTAVLSVTDAPGAPRITQQPPDQAIEYNQPVSISVSAEGVPTITNYQWYKDGSIISDAAGANLSTYTITNVTHEDSGSYSVVITNDSGSVTSASAKLSVYCQTLQIISHPASKSMYEFNTVTFTTNAQGSALSYNWQQQQPLGIWETVSPPVTSSSLTFSTQSAQNQYRYRCIVADPCGFIDTSSAALLTVIDTTAPLVNGEVTVTLTAASTFLNLRWNSPESNDPDAFKVWIMQSDSGYPSFDSSKALSFPVLTNTTQRDTIIGGLTPETQYYVALFVTDKSGNISTPITATAQTSSLKDPVNPLSLTGTYIDPVTVSLTIGNTASLPSWDYTQGEPPLFSDTTFADTIFIWYNANTALPAPDRQNPNMIALPFYDVQQSGDPYTFNATVPQLSGNDSAYFFDIALQWYPDTLLPFNANGSSVLMKDLTKPSNPCTLSGQYLSGGDYDSAVISIAKANVIDTSLVSKCILHFALDSAQSNVIITDTLDAKMVYQTAVQNNGIYTFGIQHALFAGEQKTIYSSLVLSSVNNVLSDPISVNLVVGRVLPNNTVVLTGEVQDQNNITLRWNQIDGADAMRVVWRTDKPVPLQVVNESEYPAEAIYYPAPGALQLNVSGLKAGQTYYFGAQIQVGELWSAVSENATETKTTMAPDPNKSIENTALIKSISFDKEHHSFSIVWNCSEPIDSLEFGISYGTDSSAAYQSEPQSWEPVTALSDTTTVRLLSRNLKFNTTYFFFMWMRKQGGAAALPTELSTDTGTTPDFNMQEIQYFTALDTMKINNNCFQIWYTGTWGSGSNRDTIDAVDTSSFQSIGFIPIGPGYKFKHPVPTQAFYIGLVYDSLPSGYSKSKIGLYRRDVDGKIFREPKAFNDTNKNMVYVETQKRIEPFFLLIDTTTPSVTVGSDTTTILETLTANVENNLLITDNSANTRIIFKYAKGGEGWRNNIDTIFMNNTTDSLTLTIPNEVITDDNGVRAIAYISDGNNEKVLNFSRRAKRTINSVITELKSWVPVYTTVQLDCSSVQPVLQQLLEGGNWNYDKKQFRLFRWYETNDNLNEENKWVEFSENNSNVFSLQPGKLLWLKSGKKSQRLDLGKGVTNSLKDTFTLILPAKGAYGSWTDFVLPYRFNMYIGDILRASDTAIANQLQFYSWENTEQGYGTKILYVKDLVEDPAGELLSASRGGAYCVYNPFAEEVTLKFPPTPVELSTITPQSELNKKRKLNDWKITVSTEAPGFITSQNIISYKNRGSQEPTYLPQTPQFDKSRVGFTGKNSSVLANHILFDNTAALNQVTEIAYKNASKEKRVFTSHIDISGLQPGNLNMYIWNPVTNTKEQITDTGSITISVNPQSSTKLFIITGSAAYFEDFTKKIKAWEFGLSRVYPNPFQGPVNIVYTLPYNQYSKIALSLYDAAGRRIWNAADHRHLSMGQHHIVWDGTQKSGKKIAGGFYILRLQAFDEKGSVIATRQQRLLRVP